MEELNSSLIIEFFNLKWWIQYGETEIKKWSYFYKNRDPEVFGRAEFKFDNRILKFKVADPKLKMVVFKKMGI